MKASSGFFTRLSEDGCVSKFREKIEYSSIFVIVVFV